MPPNVTQFSIYKAVDATIVSCDDLLATEEPLEIRLSYLCKDEFVQKSISVTMRTPGNDAELAKGFLFTEGIIKGGEEIIGLQHDDSNKNIIIIRSGMDLTNELTKLERNFYTTSICGVCGKSSIEAIRTVCIFPPDVSDHQINAEVLYTLPGKLRNQQEVFNNTGGLHAAALFDISGNLLLSREDVGRHNAVDKLIGASMDLSMLPLNKNLLLLSGRASFELIQKAWMSGIKIVAAVGAPSSLAVELAKEADITLIGFLRGKRFNIYCGKQRIIL